MIRSLLSLDFYGNGVTAALACLDEQTQTLCIRHIARKESTALSGAGVLDLARACHDVGKLLEEMFEYVTEPPRVVVGMRGRFLSFHHRNGYATVTSKNRTIRQSDIDDTLQSAVPPHLDETLEVLDILPLSFSVDGNDGISDPMGITGFMLGAETFITLVHTSHLANLNQVLTACKCTDYQVLATSVALGETLLRTAEMKTRTLLLDIGENSTSAILYVKGALMDGWELNVGFNTLVQKAADLLSNDEDDARKMLAENPPLSDEYTDEIWEDSAEFLLAQIKKELLQSMVFLNNQPVRLVLSGSAANRIVLRIAQEMLGVTKARIAVFDDLITDCPTDNPAYNGALALIEHALSREMGDMSITQVQEKGFLGGLFSKFGLNLF